MGTVNVNVGNDGHLQPSADGGYTLLDAAFTAHLGSANLGPTTLPRLTRAEILTLRAAAGSQATLDTAIAASSIAAPYAALMAEADAAAIQPPVNHPRRAFRAWILSMQLDWPAPP